MKSNIAPWLRLIFGLAEIRTQYEEIKRNEESKKVSVMLGWKAIKYCFWFAVFVAMAVGLGYWGMSYINTIAFFFGIILIVLAIGIGLYALAFLLFALSCSIKQIKLNRRPIGIFALVLTLVFVAAVSVIAYVVINKIK